jgi:hypothetical protein
MRNNFSSVLYEAVDEVLTGLGESVKQSLMFHLENTFDFKVYEASQRPHDFACALEELLGPGAQYVENMILLRVYDKFKPLNVPLNEKGSFDERIKEAAEVYFATLQ